MALFGAARVYIGYRMYRWMAASRLPELASEPVCSPSYGDAEAEGCTGYCIPRPTLQYNYPNTHY